MTSLASALLLVAGSGRAAEIKDVTFSTPYASGRPTTANFYYHGHAIGKGREGFAAIVEKVAQLPAGTSIVWGPNYDRCGACSGSEPRCVAKFLYPDLWEQFQEHVDGRGLFVSSDFPGPRERLPFLTGKKAIPTVVAQAAVAKEARFAVTLDWQVRPSPGILDLPKQSITDGRRWHRFLRDGEELNAFDLDLLFGNLPYNAHVLLRVECLPTANADGEPDTPEDVVQSIQRAWAQSIGPLAQQNSTQVTVATSAALAAECAALADALQKGSQQQRLVIGWANFDGAEPDLEEILFFADGRFAGRGDEGLRAIEARLEALSPGATVRLLHRTSRAQETGDDDADKDESEAELALSDFKALAARGEQFDALAAQKQLKITAEISADLGRGRATSGRHVAEFLSVGRIVRFDEKPHQPAARLAWVDEEVKETKSRRRKKSADVAAPIYTLDDEPVGSGMAGFAEAIDAIAELPRGSVVHVRICIRTKPPFTCPIVVAGHRHFERTGSEPYSLFLPWLIDVAEKRRLSIEWIPDEQKSSFECELNR